MRIDCGKHLGECDNAKEQTVYKFIQTITYVFDDLKYTRASLFWSDFSFQSTMTNKYVGFRVLHKPGPQFDMIYVQH